MGFEEEVPPVPDRLAEVKMLDRLEASWLSQPYNRYYMQEDLRQTKMEYAQYNLKVSSTPCRQPKSFSSTASSSACSHSLSHTLHADSTDTARWGQEASPSPRSIFQLIQTHLFWAWTQYYLWPQPCCQQNFCGSVFVDNQLCCIPSDQLALQIWRKLRYLRKGEADVVIDS